MSNLDRAAAWEVLRVPMRNNLPAINSVIDMLETCVNPDADLDELRVIIDTQKARLVTLAELCKQLVPWDVADADSAEARSARAYNSAVIKLRAVLDGSAA